MTTKYVKAIDCADKISKVFGIPLHDLIDVFTEIPTVDVAEVKHGRKVESAISNTGLMCTACFSDIDRDAVFCMYCGAKMDCEEQSYGVAAL